MLQKSVQSFWKYLVFTTMVSLLIGPNLAQAQIGTAFTFQGHLTQGGIPAGGLFDFEFGLFLEDSTPVGSTLQRDDVAVTGGAFAVELDFGDVFDGRELLLEVSVRPGDSGGAYTSLSPHQPLLATPYAQYSIHSSWDGLYGIPAELTDGDSDTLYQAGTGLTLTGDTFAIADSYVLPQNCPIGAVVKWNGTIWRCATDLTDGNDNNHNHLGQTWTGNNNPLVINGDFGIDGSLAPLVLNNNAGYGLRIQDAHSHGLVIDEAGADGIQIEHAGNDGVQINDATVHGIYVVSAGSNGFDVLNAGFDGIHIDAAGDDGVHVVQAGKDAFTANNAVRDGLRIFSAGEHGVHIDDSTGDALFVEHTGRNGLTVVDADFAGIEVISAGTTGMLINAAGSTGVYVAEAGAHGVYARSNSTNHYGGQFLNTASGGRGLYARAGSDAAADIVLGGNGNGNDVDNGRLISDPQYASSDLFFSSNDAIVFELDADGSGEDSDFQVRNNNGDVLLNVDEGGGLRIIDPTFARFRMTANAPASDVQMFIDARGDGTNRGQLGTLSNHDLVFFTNSQPRMILENNGDICIGSC